MTRFWAAIAAIVTAVTTGFLSALFLPAAAWAGQSGVADVARRVPRIGFGFTGALCCLIVVGGIVAVVVLVTRRRR